MRRAGRLAIRYRLAQLRRTYNSISLEEVPSNQPKILAVEKDQGTTS